MRLRNKKTGEILRVGEDVYIQSLDNGRIEVEKPLADGNMRYYYDSLSEFFKEWEDYKPKEPLIKDEKIRKAVRAWAEATERNKKAEIQYDGDSSYEYGFASIDFGIYHEDKYPAGNYTITELCGEEEA